MMPTRRSVQESRKAFDALDSIFSNKSVEKSDTQFVPPKQGRVMDVKNIKVPESLIESITGRSSEPKPQKLDEAAAAIKLNDVVAKLSSLIKEAKQILEMCGVGTTVGSLGVGPVKPMKPLKKGSKKVPSGNAKSVKIPGDTKPPKNGGYKSK